MQAPENQNGWKSLNQKVCENFAEALNATSFAKWKVESASEPSGLVVDRATISSLRYSFDKSIQGEAFLVLPRQTVYELRLRDAPEGGDESIPGRVATLLAGLQGAKSGLEESLSEFGEASVNIETVDGADLPEEHVMEFSVKLEEGEAQVNLFLCFSPKLLTAIQAAAAKPFVFPDVGGNSSTGANLDLVMDVELNVTLRFGQRQLALREVLELTSGSVVELDREVDEPVELILDGRVVARGEAVIIDGNYGMRVTQVVQPFLP